MIIQNAIKAWESRAPWTDSIQIEQDLILHGMIVSIFNDPFLAKHLAMRGGTCLNKLIWKTPFRYSEDIDLVQMNSETIGPTIKKLQAVLDSMFELPPSRESRSNGFRLFYYFYPETLPENRQKIKLEINTREHFSVEPYQTRILSLDSLWMSREASVTTFSINELFATKLRALYQRRKGRDLFDLWKSREVSPDYKRVVEIFIQYMQRNKQAVTREQFNKNIDEKLNNSTFINDLWPLLRPGSDYQVATAAKFVKENILIYLSQTSKI